MLPKLGNMIPSGKGRAFIQLYHDYQTYLEEKPGGWTVIVNSQVKSLAVGGGHHDLNPHVRLVVRMSMSLITVLSVNLRC